MYSAPSLEHASVVHTGSVNEIVEDPPTSKTQQERKVRFRDRTRYKRVYTRERLKPLQSQLWYSQEEIRGHERREQEISCGLAVAVAAAEEAVVVVVGSSSPDFASAASLYEEEGLIATKEDELCLFGLESIPQKKRKHQRIREYRRFIHSQGGGDRREERSREMLQLVSTEHVRSSALAAFERGLKQAQSVSELCHNDLLSGSISTSPCHVTGSCHQRTLSPLEAIVPNHRQLISNDHAAALSSSHPISMAEENARKETHTIHPSAAQGKGGGDDSSFLAWSDDPPSEEFSIGGDIKDYSKDNLDRHRLKQVRRAPEHPENMPPRKSPRRSSANERLGDEISNTDTVL